MAIIRWILGTLILFFNWVFTPRSLKRDPGIQASIDDETASLTLYQYKACPFCVKVRRAMKRHSLNIETRDAKRSESAREELLEGAGKLKVPCLKIEDEQGQVQWVWDSTEIIGYLENRFAVG
jgi:glutaredoxin